STFGTPAGKVQSGSTLRLRRSNNAGRHGCQKWKIRALWTHSFSATSTLNYHWWLHSNQGPNIHVNSSITFGPRTSVSPNQFVSGSGRRGILPKRKSG